MTFSIELDREDDGRWLAEVPALAGVMCYGANRDEAVAHVQALALRVIAERLEHLALREGPTRPRRPVEDRVAGEAPIWLASHARPSELA